MKNQRRIPLPLKAVVDCAFARDIFKRAQLQPLNFNIFCPPPIEAIDTLS